MVITGQKPVKKSKQWRFQVIDVVSMMKPVTKFTTSLIDASRVATTIAHAIHTAEDEKPWAVHIELPEDIAREDAHGYIPFTYDKTRRPIPDDKAIHSLIAELEKAARPCILIGAWANRKRITNYLTKVIQKYNIPFFTSQMWKWVVDERLDQYIGTAALTSGDYLHEAIAQSDLILAIGHDTIEKPTNLLEFGKTKLIHINFTEAEINELYHPNLQIIGDIGNTLWRLYEAEIHTTNRNLSPLREKANRAKKKLTETIHNALQSDQFTPARLAATLRTEIQDDAIICLDNGLYKVWFARNFPCYHANTLLLDNSLASMGAGYSAAMMTKILEPNKQVIAIVWDGWIMMNLGDLETAIKIGIDLTIIVLNDNAYGMIKRKQQGMWLEDFGLDLQNPDFVKLAEAFWAKGYSVTHPEEFLPLFRQAEAEKWVKIIEVAFVYPDEVK